MKGKLRLPALIAALLSLALLSGCGSKTLALVNMSYDPTREFYEAYNELFLDWYPGETELPLEILPSHGGSGAQARAVIEGVNADVVTLALANDVSLIERAGLIDPGWIDELPGNAAPYTSTIVFLVRAGNPKDISDWDSLTAPGVEIITPDPKSSGGACWNFLAAWEYAARRYDGNDTQMRAFVSALYDNVLVMDAGARTATTTFVENGQGDVLIAWENEAMASLREYPGEFELVTPSVSIKAEPSVAVVDENVDYNGTREIAQAYLEHLYSDEAQHLAARFGYRPSNEAILAEYADTFDLSVQLCCIDDFGGWTQAYADFFADDAIFDQIYRG